MCKHWLNVHDCMTDAVRLKETKRPCSPSPCGSNTVCKERNGSGSCRCRANYSGDPYTGCRPECVLTTDCPPSRACVSNRCVDPCPGVCGVNAQCQVINHVPVCSCVAGFTGNPLTSCQLIPPCKLY
ncbi:adhesive plaque matrix protein 2-like [Homalodisca vitripennis]|uniref:adhesive plaque matrix protein 2-like n=1 Tax=Homalodisca vitripennis TaxID=197043 RepID=UPI001EEB6BCF|nr:adhesive plaque matrix protein 2-like [Homalodisca vitripennis]